MNLFQTPEWETDSKNEKRFSILFGGNKIANDKDHKRKEKKMKKKVKNIMKGSSESNDASTVIYEINGKPEGKHPRNSTDFPSNGCSVLEDDQKTITKPKRLFKKNREIKKNQIGIKSKSILQVKETASEPITEGSSKLKRYLKLQKKKEKAKNSKNSFKGLGPNSSVMHSEPTGLATTKADLIKKAEVKSDISVEKKSEVKNDVSVGKKFKILLRRRKRREKFLAEKKQMDVDRTLKVDEVRLSKKQEKKLKKRAEKESKTKQSLEASNEVHLSKKQEKKMRKIAAKEAKRMKPLEVSNEVHLSKKQEKKMRKIAAKEAETMKPFEVSNEVHLSKKQEKKMRKIAAKEAETMKPFETSNEVHLNKKEEKKMKKIAGKEFKTMKGFERNIGTKALSKKSDASYDNSALEKPLQHLSPLKQNVDKNLKKRERRRRKRKISIDSTSDAPDGNFISASNGQVQEKDIPSDNSIHKKKLFKIKKKKIEKMLEDVEPLNAGIESKNTLYSLKKKRISENQTVSMTSSKKPKKNFTPLRERMTEQLKSARFRWLNEQLYTSNSWDALKYFKDDPEAYEAYHSGYRSQVAQWPLNPVDVIIKDLSSSPPGTVVADFGCGEARLEECLPKLKVHSLDLVASKPNVVACDMAHTPLLMQSVNVAVFCLSLMGTNLNDFLLEANRVLKVGGIMKIAEVESRFEDVDNFSSELQQFGFQLKKKDFSHKLFYFMDFKKIRNVSKTGKLPNVALSPCVYKKR